MKTYLYYMDLFMELPIPPEELLSVENPAKIIKLLDTIKRYVDVEVHGVKGFKVFRGCNCVVVEYILSCNLGEVSVKIIAAENPIEALQQFYSEFNF